MPGTDPHAETNEFTARVLDQADQPVVSAGAALEGNLQPPQLDIDLVVDDDQRGARRSPKVTTNRPDRPAAFVHIGLRLRQQNAAPSPIEGRDFRLKLALLRPGTAMVA